MLKIITKCEAINNLDLNPIKRKLMDSYPDVGRTLNSGWTEREVDTVAEYYKAFLYLLITYPDELIIPIRSVDEFWHVHILFTEKYHRDCQKISGRYLHHNPHLDLENKQKIQGLESFKRTYELLILEFPEVANDNTTSRK